METPLQPNQIPQPEPQPVQPAPSVPNSKSHIFSTHLLVFVVYFVGAMMVIQNNPNSGAIFLLALYLVHGLLLIIFSIIRFVRKQPREAAMYGFTALAIIIIGFGACTASIFSGFTGLEI
jgi:tryptophan-rich sensory protein